LGDPDFDVLFEDLVQRQVAPAGEYVVVEQAAVLPPGGGAKVVAGVDPLVGDLAEADLGRCWVDVGAVQEGALDLRAAGFGLGLGGD
jgi:hypothetical protein